MSYISRVSGDVSFINDPVSPHMTSHLASDLISKSAKSKCGKHSYGFQANDSVQLYDYISCFQPDFICRPHKCIGHVRSFIVLDGSMEVLFFDDAGNVTSLHQINCSSYREELAFYIKIPANSWYSFRITSDQPCIIKETSTDLGYITSKNFFEGSIFCDDEYDAVWFDSQIGILRSFKHRSIKPERFEKVSDNLFISTRRIITVSFDQLKPIIIAASVSPLKRARLCCHSHSSERLHEMFIALAHDTVIEDALHLHKDESVTAVEGKGDYIFTNKDGSSRNKLTIEGYNSISPLTSSTYFLRVNRFTSHRVTVSSPFLLIHEATTGPFDRMDTIIHDRPQ